MTAEQDTAKTPPKFPLIVGVTGHRDITAAGRQAVADTVRTLLLRLKRWFGDDSVYLLSGLAQGADQLAAFIAVANGIKLIAALPMPLVDYRATMARDPIGLANFELLRQCAALEIVLPYVYPPDGPTSHKLQYEQLGAVLSRYSHILLALWDGERWETLTDIDGQDSRGGTAHVVYLRATGERDAEGFRFSPLFAGADSRLDIARGGPALQVVTPRVRKNGATADLAGSETAAGDCIMLRVQQHKGRRVTLGQITGRPARLTDELKVLFGDSGAHELGQIEQLNTRIRHHFNLGDRGIYLNQFKELRPKLSVDLAGPSRDVLDVMRRLQASADTAAQRYQRRLLRTWPPNGVLLALAVLGPMAVGLFSAYAHLPPPHLWLLLAYLAALGAGFALYCASKAGEWQNRFQDYRALAEAMRIQKFWALSSVPRAVSDHYLRMQSDDLGWVQFALRGPALWAAALSLRLDRPEYALINECWIEAQHTYYAGDAKSQGKAAENHKLHEAMEIKKAQWIAWAMVLTALLLGVALSVDSPGELVETPRDVLLLLIPTALAIGAGFAFCSQARAYEAHAHSYTTMGRIFERASREASELASANDTAGYTRLVFDLGREALAENAEWLKDHRSRPIAHEVH